jgi:hypothetical protein
MLPAEAPHLSTLSKISSFVIRGMVCSSETFYSMDAVERPHGWVYAVFLRNTPSPYHAKSRLDI